MFGWLKKQMGWSAKEDTFAFWVDVLTGPDDVKGFLVAYNRTPEIWRNLIVARLAYNDIGNGGLGQFFYNSTGDMAPEAVEGFIALGMPKAAQALETAMGSFGQPYSRDRDVRIAAIKAFPEVEIIGNYPSTHRRFADLDDVFSDCMENEAMGFEQAAERYAGPYGQGEI